MEDKIRVLVPEKDVDAKIAELGKKISEDYAGRQVHLVCVLKGGVFFMCELAQRELRFPLRWISCLSAATVQAQSPAVW